VWSQPRRTVAPARTASRRLRQLEAQEVDRTVAAVKKKVALQEAELAKLEARKVTRPPPRLAAGRARRR
jgi:hypothetical protein